MGKEVLIDLGYFLANVAVNAAVFLVLHIVACRWRPGWKLAPTLNKVIGVSVLVGLLVSFVAFRSSYSSTAAYALGTVGATLTSIFALGLYSFAGPICADRSDSAHMAMVLMEHSDDGISAENLRKVYAYEKGFERRLSDFVEARIVQVSDGKLKLTRKGIVITSLFVALSKLLRIPRHY